MTRSSEIKVLVAMAVVVLFRYWNLVTPNKAAREYLLRDFVSNGQLDAFLDAVKQGSLLLWDVTTGAGSVLGDGVLTAYYPLNVLYLPFIRSGLIVHHVFQYALVFHFVLMGMFMYWLLRELGSSRSGAFIAGLIYMFNGYTLVHAMHLPLIQTMAWLPLTFLMIERSRRTKELLPSAWAGIALGMGVLGGHPQVYYYAALAVTIHAFFWMVAGWREPGSRRERIRPMAHLFVLGTVTLGTSAVLTFPSLSNALASVHATAGAEFKWLNPLAFYQLMMFVIPWGLDAVQDWGILVSERYAYMGWVTLIFGLGALIWRREARTSVYAVIAGIGLVLAMGENGFLFKFFFDNVPGYGMFRYPSRVLVLVAFGLTVLAGLGLDRYLSEEDGRGARRSLPSLLRTLALGGLAVWVLAVGSLTASVGSGVHDLLVHFVSQLSLALVVVWLWWGVAVAAREGGRGRGFGAAVVVIVLFDLWSPGGIGERVPSPDRLRPDEEAAVEMLRDRKRSGELFRIENRILRESLLQRYAISSFNTESRLMGGGYLDLMWAAKDNPRILDLLNVRYAVGSRPVAEKGTRVNRDTELGNLDLGPFGTKTLDLSGEPARAGQIELASKVRYGGHIPQGETVAQMEVWERTGRRHRFPIRAGIETADWAAGSPKAGARHGLAEIADSWPVENKDEKYEGHSYRAILTLPAHTEISRVELRYVRTDAQLEIERLNVGRRDLTKLPEDRFERLSPEIIRNRYALERAFLVPEARVIADPEEMKQAVRWFDPGRIVLLSKAAPLPPGEGKAVGGGGAAKVASYSPWKVVIDVETPIPQYLVVSEAFHPWWRARLDGQRAEILRANMALRAVVVPAGRHTVEFYMVPVSFYAGAGITAATILGIAGIHFRARRRRKSGPNDRSGGV